jgi:hypothetical protein
MEETREKYIRWSEDCVWQTFGDTATIMRVSQQIPELIPTEKKSPGVRLNEVGKDIWDLCDGTRSIDRIVSDMTEEYEGDLERIRSGVENAISELVEKGFLTWEDDVKPYCILEIPLDKYVIWDDNVLWNEVEGQVIAMNNETGISFEFTKELGEIWKLCDGKKTANEIFSTIQEKKITDENASLNGFTLLLKQFVKLGMLTLKDEP